jgi:hypothetical protein
MRRDTIETTMPGLLAPDPGDPFRTDVSSRVKVLADCFNAMSTWIARWKVEMTLPGQSTSGQPVQHLVLQGPYHRPIVIGSVNPLARTAELRPLRLVSERHRERTGLPLPLRVADYWSHVEVATRLLEQCGLTVDRPLPDPR